jgi:hypothetical protein
VEKLKQPSRLALLKAGQEAPRAKGLPGSERWLNQPILIQERPVCLACNKALTERQRTYEVLESSFNEERAASMFQVFAKALNNVGVECVSSRLMVVHLRQFGVQGQGRFCTDRCAVDYAHGATKGFFGPNLSYNTPDGVIHNRPPQADLEEGLDHERLTLLKRSETNQSHAEAVALSNEWKRKKGLL